MSAETDRLARDMLALAERLGVIWWQPRIVETDGVNYSEPGEAGPTNPNPLAALQRVRERMAGGEKVGRSW
jgi:hypothetical protein